MTGSLRDSASKDLWERIRRLEGRALPMMGTKIFAVTRVEPDKETAVTVVPSTGIARTVLRREIEDAYRLGLRRDDIRPGKLQAQFPSMHNTSYVAGILRAISESK